MDIKIKVSFVGYDHDRGVSSNKEYSFYINDDDYREFFGVLCAGCDNNEKCDDDFYKRVIRKFGIEEIIQG